MKSLLKAMHLPAYGSMLRIAFLLTLCLSVSPLSITRAQGLTGQTSNDPAFRRISNRVLCQCGCNYMVLSCNMLDCASATYIRKAIRTSLAEGQNEEMILAGFVEQYGPRILAEPPREGFFWMGWIMPFVGLLFGAAAVTYVLWKWNAARKTEAPDALSASPAPPVITPSSDTIEKYRAQIDQELENN